MVIVVMGVSGSGKTTVGQLLAKALGVPFYDADNYHPQANVEKMAQGIPLTDEDRLPWLERLREAIALWQKNGGAVLACSALKVAYRDILSCNNGRVEFLYLKGSHELLRERLSTRKGHFFPVNLLTSQLATLEEPAEAITVDVALAPEQIVQKTLEELARREELPHGEALACCSCSPGEIIFAEGGPEAVITLERARQLLEGMLAGRELHRVLLLPPDFTRFHSWAGELTVLLYEMLKDKAHVEILPATGTHFPMTSPEIEKMFPGIPERVFRQHNWREDLVQLGTVPASYVKELSGGKVDYPISCEVNRLLVEGNWDLIISLGQAVPHEVVGIANQNKNLFVGVGGKDIINKTHFLGAAYGMEAIMGREASPVREVFNYCERHFACQLPLLYVLTVRQRAEDGSLVTRGLFAGKDRACFLPAAKLCQKVNLDQLDKPLKKVVVYLRPDEYKSTWLGNKAIYRTRMAIADGGELVILAPGVREFGEDPAIDALIRRFGYLGTPHTLKSVAENPDLAQNLSAAAHLIHGSSEGRFSITYCPGELSREEVETAGYRYAPLGEMLKRYPVEKLKDGWNTLVDGEEFFFISNPALGLWALKSHFEAK